MITTNFPGTNKLFKQKQISFNGYNIERNKTNDNYTIQFYTPGKETQKGKTTVSLINDDLDKTTSQYEFNNYENGLLLTDKLELIGAGERLKYKFNTSNIKPDKTIKTKDGYNLTSRPEEVSHKQNHSIYHLMADNFNPTEAVYSEGDKKGEPIRRRNHFDLYGGDLRSIINKLDYIKELQPGRIMGSPIFGKDSISSHGYWTENPYQISSNLGTIEDFDELNLKLFKIGSGWIADGAFVNQGLNGVQFQELLRNTAQGKSLPSEFKDYFTSIYTKGGLVTKQTPNANYGNDLNLGILPCLENEKINYHAFDIKFKNSPLNIKFDKQKNEYTTEKNSEYNQKKPTYIQLFDPTENDQTHKQDDVFRSHHSIQHYEFPVDSLSIQEKINSLNKAIKKNTYKHHTEMYKDEFCEWNNFNLTTASNAKGIQLWDGNTDVLKINTKNPNVRKYIMDAGKFWTTRIDNTLVKNLAINLQKVIKENNYKKAIQDLCTNKELPEKANKIDIDKILKKSNEPILKISDSITDSIKDFPMASIELPKEFQAILTSPKFSKKITNNKLYEKLENYITTKVGNNLSSDNNSKINDLEIFRFVRDDILRSIILKAVADIELLPGEKLIDLARNNDPKETDENKTLNKFLKNIEDKAFSKLDDSDINNCSDKIIKNILKTLQDEKYTNKLAKSIDKELNKLDKNTLRISKLIINKLEAGLDWRIDAAKDIGDQDGIKNKDKGVTYASELNFTKEFWTEFYNNLKKINPKVYMIGELTDVTDIINNVFLGNSPHTLATKEQKDSMAKILKAKEPIELKDKDYNVVANYLKDILQVKNAYECIQERRDDGQKNDQGTIEWGKKLLSMVPECLQKYGTNEHKPLSVLKQSDLKEIQDYLKLFDEKKAFSHETNYRYMYGSLHRAVHKHPDGGEGQGHISPKEFKDEINELLFNWPINAANYAHNCVDNQDKSRILHSLLIDPVDFKENPSKAMSDVLKFAFINADIDPSTKNKASKLTNSIDQIYKKDNYFDNPEDRPFGYQTIENAIQLVIDDFKKTNKNNQLNENEISSIKTSMKNVLFKTATNKYLKMLYTMMAVPGSPEIYAGTEFGMTGGETAMKNKFVQNRNPLPWIMLDDNNGKAEIKNLNQKIKSIFSLRNKPELSALNNGFTIDITSSEKKDKNEILALLRYNEDSQVLAIVNYGKIEDTNSSQTGYMRANQEITEKGKVEDIKINMKKSNLPTGTLFKNAENNNDLYIIWKDNILRQLPSDWKLDNTPENYKGEDPSELEIKHGKILYRINEINNNDIANMNENKPNKAKDNKDWKIKFNQILAKQKESYESQKTSGKINYFI